MKKGHPEQPIVIFPDIRSHFESHFEVSFSTFSQKVSISVVLFSVLFHTHFFDAFLCISWLVEPYKYVKIIGESFKIEVGWKM